MQIVIEIPEEMYQEIKETNMVISGRRNGKRIDYILFNAVDVGIPLPKGHGDLKDADAIVNGFDSSDLDNSDPIENYSNACNIINSFPVIVPADKR